MTLKVHEMKHDGEVAPDEQPRSTIARFRKGIFDDGGLDKIFRHVSNTIASSLIMAAGLYTVKYQGSLDLWGVLDTSIAGYSVAFLGMILFVLNLLDGIHQLAKFRWHFMLQIALVVVYLMVTIRVEQIVLNFRTS